MRNFWKKAVKSPQRREPPLASGGWVFYSQTPVLFSMLKISTFLIPPALIFVSI